MQPASSSPIVMSYGQRVPGRNTRVFFRAWCCRSTGVEWARISEHSIEHWMAGSDTPKRIAKRLYRPNTDNSNEFAVLYHLRLRFQRLIPTLKKRAKCIRSDPIKSVLPHNYPDDVALHGVVGRRG